jgi:energy-coupling factor transport system permease protein
MAVNPLRRQRRELLQLDPRTKLVVATAYAVVLMFTVHLSAIAVETAAVSLLVVALKLTPAWSATLRVLVPMTAFLVVVMLFSFDLATALAAALRLVAVTTTFFIFFQTTAPEDLASALIKIGVPYAFAFILTAAMQYVPVLSHKMQDVMDAQRARGIRLERDLASIPNYPALFAPLLIQSFTLADQLAEAMEARGFGCPHRTCSEEYMMHKFDFVIMALALTGVVLAWQIRS